MAKALVILFLTGLLTGCEAVASGAETIYQAALTAQAPAQTAISPDILVPEVISVRPHDVNAFTQGLLIAPDGRMFESTGLEGQSSLREVDPQTGEVLRRVDLAAEYFAEGLALVDHRLIQLTWRNQVAFVYDVETFEQIGTFTYTGEGWGLCYDPADDVLYMSDGSQYLYMRDPRTFEVISQIEVTFEGQPVIRLNELECVDENVYANIWLTDFIVEIDQVSGIVQNVIDASGLLTPEEIALSGTGRTLNGIALDPITGNFMITGKLFPKLFEVRFIPLNE
jgi:glutaminyl-peptide cyclotransferase